MLGFLVVTAASSTDATRRAEAPRRAQLLELIETRREQVAAHDEDVRRLRRQVASAQAATMERVRQDAAEAQRLVELAAQAGTVALRGRGVVVKLSDSDRDPDDPEESGAYRIHDTDLQQVVNALFAAGAEAVAVNDSRLVATSPIRAAGDTIVVNFRPLAPPYRVVAIGADRKQFGDSAIARRFGRWTRLFGLGFSVDVEDEVEVPAYTGRVGINSATPVAVEDDAGSPEPEAPARTGRRAPAGAR
ncbi:MAG: DUF881 domain-containing protein [Actinomycetota bacterium]|nr:DUF881 domain-containing protein [Actinomycetota bacterium]